MKLYFISNRITQPVTGGEKYNQALLEGARAAGIEVEPWEAINLPRVLRTIPVMNLIHCLKILKADKNAILMIDLDFHFRYFVFLRLAKMLRKMKIVGVLFHYNHSYKSDSLKKKIQYLTERYVSRQCDYLITLSKFSLQNFIKVAGKEIPNTILNPYVKNSRDEKPVITERLPRENRFLLVGNIEYRKNVDTLLIALSDINCDFHLDIVGKTVSERYVQDLYRLIRELKLDARVHLNGKVSQEELDRFYSQSTLFTLVSRMEGFGIVYAEAMRYGLPIIATKKGAVPEIVEDGQNGILCDPEDPKGISRAIEKIIGDPALRQFLAENNRQKYMSFMDRDTFVGKSKVIFQNLNK